MKKMFFLEAFNYNIFQIYLIEVITHIEIITLPATKIVAKNWYSASRVPRIFVQNWYVLHSVTRILLEVDPRLFRLPKQYVPSQTYYIHCN